MSRNTLDYKAPPVSPSAVEGGDLGLSLLHRPFATGVTAEGEGFIPRLTFKNIVIGIVASTLLIFIGGALSPAVATLFAVFAALLGLVLREMAARRRWENGLMAHIHRLQEDYDRLVRDIARTRNDAAALRRKLAGAGSALQGVARGKGGEADVGQRMARAIAEQLAALGDLDDSAVDVAPAPFVENFAPPPFADAGAADIGQKLSDDQVLQLVHAAVRQDRIDMFVQPIVNLPQRKLRFYEAFSGIRILPDVYLPASRYVRLAAQHQVMPMVDNLLLLRGLQALLDGSERDYNNAFFFNVTALTLNDSKFMGDLVEFVSQNRTLAPQIVFEMAQADLAAVSDDAVATLDGLSRLGCRFSMDQVRNLAFAVETLEDRHIRFIKVEASLLLPTLKEISGLPRLKRLKADLDRAGIDIIVEKVETERQLLELLDIEVDYGQGFLFGKPTVYKKQ